MRRALVLLIALAMMAIMAAPATAADPIITLENPPPGDLLELAVGESYEFDVTLTSDDEPFILAIALTDQFYPGRGVFFAGSDRATRATTADLHLTITGKQPTDLLPDGVAPVAIVVGVRYKGGLALSQRFDFNVRVS